MAKYRKKPVVIEAIQYTGENKRDILEFAKNNAWPETCSSAVIITTIDRNNARIDIGDWLLKGVVGEFYPCKPDIFEQTYELVDAGKE